MLRFAALLALAPLLASPLAAQDAAAHDADPVAAGLAALDAAARWQRGETPRQAPATLHGRFHVQAHDDKGNLVQMEVERWYTREPERILTRRTEDVTGLSSTVGWDGQVAWFRDDRKGTIIDYSAKPELFGTDLNLLHDQLRITRLLLDALVLDALRPRLADVRLVGHAQLTDLDHTPHELRLVQATAPDELNEADPLAPPPAPDAPPPRLTLTFGIDAKDGTLWTLQVRAPGRDDYALHFDWHGRTRDGLHVPGNIQVFRAGDTQPESKLGVEEDDTHELQLDLDVTVDATMFARPAAAADH